MDRKTEASDAQKNKKVLKNEEKPEERIKKIYLFLPPMKSVEALIPVLMYVLLLVLKYFLCRVLSDAKPANATQHFNIPALGWVHLQSVHSLDSGVSHHTDGQKT